MQFSMAPDNGRVNRVSKLIVNPDTGPIYCCWDTCDRRSRQTWTIRVHEHAKGLPCDHPLSRHANYTFCSQAHADYWGSCSGWNAHELAAYNQGRIYGMHSEGNHLRRPAPAPEPRPQSAAPSKIYVPGVGYL